jgi:hypothetical protein
MITINKNYLIRQSSKLNSNKKDYFDWSIWIESGKENISKIDYVEYLLHSTFKNRLREVNSHSDGFLLSSNGWGEFEIHINIILKSGKTIQLKHWLKLGENYINQLPDGPKVLEDKNGEIQKIYISYSAPDIKKAINIKGMLSDLGMQVVSGMDMNLGNEISDFMHSSIQSSDLVVNINSDNETEWQKEENRVANKLSKTIVSSDDFIKP